eukprot:CAMPEP_0196131992 /NCGR_PEP_ID=MMETSP0910-20130528/1769_1 /TAXON_ID=49265 /ORGANISM="Thalassiosira rotula, Strain GSO102" /LENGTH=34 /DNA_ID= /DNA_START= /DNA_END= /DNA_ORIENTATION=
MRRPSHRYGGNEEGRSDGGATIVGGDEMVDLVVW